MKARVKSTRDIVDVIAIGDYINENGQIIGEYKDANGMSYNSYDLDFYIEEGVTIPDYWTRFEHQAGIAAMQGLLAHEGTEFRNYLPQEAKDIARALVEKYKKEERE